MSADARDVSKDGKWVDLTEAFHDYVGPIWATEGLFSMVSKPPMLEDDSNSV